jgi:hypothetical protein
VFAIGILAGASITRGKKLVMLVGQKKAVAIAVRNVSGTAALVEAFRMAETSVRFGRREGVNVMTLSARDLLEASQALDVVVDVRDAVHGVQHHHVST